MRIMDTPLQMTDYECLEGPVYIVSTGVHIPDVGGVRMEQGDQVVMFVDSPNDAVKQYNVCIDTWSLRHLTSAEEYPDEEYLDMSKSSSLKDKRHQQLDTSVLKKHRVKIILTDWKTTGKDGKQYLNV